MLVDTRLNKWGNSWAIRIPNTFLQELQLDPTQPLNISVEKGQIIIKKTSPHTLKSLIKAITPENRHGEIQDNYQPLGKEITW